ncbi:hypothetical protein J2Y38_000859 [Flavobacterium sp. 2755]|nr:hypothetical protein [Flavobacterium sp. 2755]MDR6760661.1 hypothetical protein [Flavobacterium sp. 2755]
MTNDSFNWKKLFINEEQSDNEQSEFVREKDASLNSNNQFPV